MGAREGGPYAPNSLSSLRASVPLLISPR